MSKDPTTGTELADTELVDERQAWLLEQVNAERRVTTNEAAARLGVSVDTVRRDLRQLHDQGLLKRVHGGAVPVSRLPGSFSGRSSEASGTVPALAAEIVKRFKPGQVIGLDGGSTSVEIASRIPATLSVIVVTNNPAVAVAMADHASATVILLGGQVDLRWMASTGSEAVDGWRDYRLDIGVLGVCGLEAEAGLTTNSANEVATKRALVESSTEVIVAVHKEKVGVQAPFVVAGLDSVGLVVTNSELPTVIRKRLKKHATEIVVV